jgi:hypothetical protein
MDTTGEFFLEAGATRLRKNIAGFFFLAIAWPGEIYTRSEPVE